MTVKNPNALVGLGGTVGGGEIVVNIAKLLGWSISTGWGIAIAGAVSYVVLFVGREGVAGIWNLIVHGNKSKLPAAAASKPTATPIADPPPPEAPAGP